jgi:predicted DNA binding CopG/RHH family protein
MIKQAIERRKKDAVLNIRINSYDLEALKQKARKIGVKYQTLISEILHKVAEA